MPQPLCFNFVPPAQPSPEGSLSLLKGEPRGEGKTTPKDPTFYYLVATLNTAPVRWHAGTHTKLIPLTEAFQPKNVLVSAPCIIKCTMWQIIEKTIPKYFHSASWQYFLQLKRKAHKAWEAAIAGSPHTRETGDPTSTISKDPVSSSIKIPLAVIALFFSIPFLIWFSMSCLILQLFSYQKSQSSCNIYFSNFFTQKGRLVFSWNLSCLLSISFPIWVVPGFIQTCLSRNNFLSVLMCQCKKSKWNIHTKLQQYLLFSCKVY